MCNHTTYTNTSVSVRMSGGRWSARNHRNSWLPRPQARRRKARLRGWSIRGNRLCGNRRERPKASRRTHELGSLETDCFCQVSFGTSSLQLKRHLTGALLVDSERAPACTKLLKRPTTVPCASNRMDAILQNLQTLHIRAHAHWTMSMTRATKAGQQPKKTAARPRLDKLHQAKRCSRMGLFRR